MLQYCLTWLNEETTVGDNRPIYFLFLFHDFIDVLFFTAAFKRMHTRDFSNNNKHERMNERYINGNHSTANIRDVNAQNMSNMILLYGPYL